ncbi:MAG TPA: AAA family ATPase [Candidatus Babeliales bacterium]|nr:AAA family ATPase [Candidatus Babeliales bacterium]
MKRLPIGIQTFETLINQNYTYVDKTAILHRLIISGGNRYFLSRPRRFGKSLTCSTLDAIFQGRKELFNNLAISKVDYDWKIYPVIRLDFSGIIHQTLEQLFISLNHRLDSIAKDYNVDISFTTLPQEKFKTLIIECAKKHGPTVVIIDEYDKPILDHLSDSRMAQEMRNFLKSFYGILKDQSIDTNVYFLFITGVSKFSKVSIFSELNNLNDLTNDEITATLCGYTQKELELVFADHIETFASHSKKTRQETVAELKYWYNGYQFSKNGQKVYNPFSIINSFSKNEFMNFWFSSGTPSFIMHYAEKNPEIVKKLMMLEAQQITVTQLETLTLENYFQSAILIFLQAGYLTIADYNANERLFNLAYPNYEVRLSMTEQILGFVAHIDATKIASSEYRLRKSLYDGDIETFCTLIKDFFELLPHTVIIDREKFYQGVFFTITKLIGAKIDAEQATSRGYIDAVLENNNTTYIIEFKKDKTPDIALAQIEDKEYFKKFKIENTKSVVLVGINFDYLPKSGISMNWKIKKI